ncbi:MAG: rhomboid family intramembrane serine protease [Armatimonadetes bacterium]|nr:rhomboid family intramembrane serine protease [Armatimonadota bacterium]
MPDDFDFTSPRRKRATENVPYITYALIIASIILTAAYWLSMERSTATSLISQLSVQGVRMERLIWQGHLQYFLLNIFYHGSWAHLLFNMYWTYKLGSVLEVTLPRYAYLGFLVGAALISNGVELALFGQAGIGISGVVYALFGLLWAGRGKYESWRFTVSGETYKTFVVWAVLCVITTYMGVMNIANGAHFGGMLFGMAIGWLFVSPRRKIEWAIPLALMTLITILSITWLPWRTEWYIYKSEEALRKKQYAQAVNWYERGLKSIGSKPLLYYAGLEAWMAVAQEAYEKRDEKGIAKATEQLDEIEKRLQEASEAYRRGAARESSVPDIQNLQGGMKGKGDAQKGKGAKETNGDD